MRAIFVTLIAANLLLFVAQWFWWRAEPPAPDSGRSAPVQEGASLELLSPAARRSVQSQDRAASDAPRYCAMVGPFSGADAAGDLMSQLHALDVGAWVEELEVSDGEGYWVYLAPEVSQQAAVRLLYELQAKSVDSYVIPRGELANGISLGMYVSEASAEARQAEVRDLGYDARLRAIDRTLRETWVLMPRREARSLAESRWEALLEGAPGAERRENLCPGVASE